MSNQIMGYEIVEAEFDESVAHLYLRVELARLTPRTSVRAWLVGPLGTHGQQMELAQFQPLKLEDEAEDCLDFEVQITRPSFWSPRSPACYNGEVELWEDGRFAGRFPLHYSYYELTWEENSLSLNDEPVILKVRERETLDEVAAQNLIAEGVNVVVLPASESAAWDVADRLGLLLLGELPENGDLPEDLSERSVRPCSLGWVVPSPETPLPAPEEESPGLFGLRSPVPLEDLPEGIEFLLLDQDPDLAAEESLGYPWLVRHKR